MRWNTSAATTTSITRWINSAGVEVPGYLGSAAAGAGVVLAPALAGVRVLGPALFVLLRGREYQAPVVEEARQAKQGNDAGARDGLLGTGFRARLLWAPGVSGDLCGQGAARRAHPRAVREDRSGLGRPRAAPAGATGDRHGCGEQWGRDAAGVCAPREVSLHHRPGRQPMESEEGD